MKKIIFILFFTCLFFETKAQNIIYQDICNCGVSAAGFSSGMGYGSGTINLYIEPGSTIKKAFLLTYRIGYPINPTFVFNGIPFEFDSTKFITQFNHKNPFASPIRIYYEDFTQYINPNTTNYSINIPIQNGSPINWSYWSSFLIVEYETPLLPITSFNIVCNNQNIFGDETYIINDINPINSAFQVGFSLYSDRTGAFNTPNNIILFNGSFVGVVGGSDSNSTSWPFSGVKGHFYYQNNQLFGLDDDTPDNIMGGSDGLADVSTYIPNLSTSYNFEVKDINYPNQSAAATSINLSYILSYTTPCGTFSANTSSDTSMCAQDSLVLAASGGVSYEWDSPNPHALNDLSCTTCASPVFSGDSSRFYTVRIWSSDSCSVVRPVHILVHPKPKVPAYSIEKTVCGQSTGSVQFTSASPISVSLDGGAWQNNLTFTNLAAGQYPFAFLSSNGCVTDTVLTIEDSITAQAAFSVTPTSGYAPLEITITNESSNALTYSWFVDSEVQEDPFTAYLLQEPGTHTITLIAYPADSSCADTSVVSILVRDTAFLSIPNVFSPNQDGINDCVTLTSGNDIEISYEVLNRWGNVMKRGEEKLPAGVPVVIWDGVNAVEGVYFLHLHNKSTGTTKVYEISLVR